jgi:hypothetical protein
MNKLVPSTAAAVFAGLATLSVAPIPAKAEGFAIEIGPDGPQFRLRNDRCDPRYERCRRNEVWREDDDWRDGNWRRGDGRFCTEERALGKAERMGIRRARVVSAGRYEIVVGGRDRYGDRVAIAFGRDRRCPVID